MALSGRPRAVLASTCVVLLRICAAVDVVTVREARGWPYAVPGSVVQISGSVPATAAAVPHTLA